MKKKIIIGISTILILTFIGVLVFVLFSNKEKPSDEVNETLTSVEEESLEKKIFSLINYDDLTALVAAENLDAHYFFDNTLAEIGEFVFLGSSSEMSITLDDKGNLETIEVYSQIYDSSKFSSNENGRTIEEDVYDECRGIIINFVRLFGAQYTHDLQLTNYDGTFSKVDEAKDMADIINGKSYINFAVRDKNGNYYVMNIVWFESVLEVNIVKYYDVEGYIDYFADISLFEED